MSERQGRRPGERRRVVKEHRASHTDPITMRAGDLVTVGRRDPTWPDYLWCIGPDGREGWVPEAFLNPAGPAAAGSGDAAAGDAAAACDAARAGGAAARRARRDYDARELDVAPGDAVIAGEEAGGWFWCEVPDGRRGWVPAGCLAPADA